MPDSSLVQQLSTVRAALARRRALFFIFFSNVIQFCALDVRCTSFRSLAAVLPGVGSPVSSRHGPIAVQSLCSNSITALLKRPHRRSCLAFAATFDCLEFERSGVRFNDQSCHENRPSWRAHVWPPGQMAAIIVSDCWVCRV